MNVNFIGTFDNDYIYIYNYELIGASDNVEFEYLDSSSKWVKLGPKIYPLNRDTEKYDFKYKISEKTEQVRVISETQIVKIQKLISEQDYQNNIGHFSSIFSQAATSSSTNPNFECVFDITTKTIGQKTILKLNLISGIWEGNLHFQYSYISQDNKTVYWSSKFHNINQSDVFGTYEIDISNIGLLTKLVAVRAIDDKNNYKTILIMNHELLEERPISSISKTHNFMSSGYGGEAGNKPVEENLTKEQEKENISSGTPNSAAVDFESLYNLIKQYIKISEKASHNLAIGSVFNNAYNRPEKYRPTMEDVFNFVGTAHGKYNTDVAGLSDLYFNTKKFVYENYDKIKPRAPYQQEIQDKNNDEYKRMILTDVYNSNILSHYNFFSESKNIYNSILTILRKYAIV